MAGRTDSVACTVWAEFYAVESFDRMPDPTARIATNEREDMNASLSITLADYQAGARRTARYPGHGLQGLSYTALGLAGEAGEVANKVKKVIRDDRATLTDEARNAIADELGDVLWYAAMLAHELGVSLEAVAARNLAKLRDRAERVRHRRERGCAVAAGRSAPRADARRLSRSTLPR
jgi:NTP pyrophosphatase (non-canonical NTP hydrolase)